MNKWINKLKKQDIDKKTSINIAFGIGFDVGQSKGVSEKLYKLIQENLQLRLKLNNFTKAEIKKQVRDIDYWKKRDYRSQVIINKLKKQINDLRPKK